MTVATPEIVSAYKERNERDFMLKNLKKKFFRDFSDTDFDIVAELQDYMKGCYLQIPPYLIEKMIERGIIPDNLSLFDDDGEIIRENLHSLNKIHEYEFVNRMIDVALPFEFSNEGVQNPYSPYRMVWAAEHGDITYFLKTALPPRNHIVRVVDVWTKKGGIPLHPLASQKEFFDRGRDWNIYDLVEDMVEGLEKEIEEA